MQYKSFIKGEKIMPRIPKTSSLTKAAQKLRLKRNMAVKTEKAKRAVVNTAKNQANAAKSDAQVAFSKGSKSDSAGTKKYVKGARVRTGARVGGALAVAGGAGAASSRRKKSKK